MSQTCNHNHFDFSKIKDEKLKRWVTLASVSVAFVLIISKVIAWYLTGSVSVLSSLADSLLDLFASLLSLLAVRQAMKPADETHRFGFGKVEALAALSQSMFIFVSVLYVAYEALMHLDNPKPISQPFVGIVVMLIAVVLTFGLVSFQSYVIKKTNSIAITADAMHYKADMYLNLGVLTSILLSYYLHQYWVDGVIGLLVAAYIFYTSIGIARESIYILMDRELDEKKKEKVIALIKAHPQVHGLHELKTRSSGTWDFIQVHLEMEGDLTLTEAHKITHEIEKTVRAAFPRIHLTVHQDPRGLKENHVEL